jgi:arginase family enzyme
VSTHRVHAGYVGIPSFFQCPVITPDTIRGGLAVVTGVPIDQGIVFGKPGTRFGPRAIRESSTASRAFFSASPENTQVDVDTHVALRVKDAPLLADLGDVDIDPTDIMKTTHSVMEAVADITRRGGMPVVLGGDHYIAYPSFEGFVRGLTERKPAPRVGYLHIDTHSDFRDEYVGGGRYNHGTAVRRVSESPAVSYKNMAWLGLSGPVLDAGSYRLYRQHRLKMLTARMLRERGAREVVREAMEAVAADTDGVYVSIDIDVVNGSDAPGTGASVFTGILAREFLEIMEVLASYDVIHAVDLCEVSPPLDTPGVRTADLAVSGLLTLLERRVFDRVTVDPDR